MDDDSDTEMADYGTDFSDDVDRNFDAKARRQQGPTVEIRSRRRSFAGAKLRLYDEAGFDEDKARRDAINSFQNIWTNWTHRMELAATIDWAIQDCVKDPPLWKSVDAENVTKNMISRPPCRTTRLRRSSACAIVERPLQF